MSKVLKCVFDEGVFCAHRKSEKYNIFWRCDTCRVKIEFYADMDREEEEFFEEMERLREKEEREKG